MKLVLASQNKKKLVEMNDILSQLGVEVCSEAEAGVDVEVEETGTTFEENSLLKAEAVMKASGMPAIADDSGLCVDALNGAPGVYSARYGGPELDDTGRYRLALCDGGNIHADGNQCSAQAEKARNGAKGSRHVDIAKGGQHNGVQGNNGQGNQKHHHQSQELSQHHLGHGNGQRIEQLIGSLPPLLRQHPHGQNRHNHQEHKAHAAQNIFKVGGSGLKVVHHGVNPRKQQQKGSENVAAEVCKIG